MALVAGGVGQAQVFVMWRPLLFLIQDFLQLPDIQHAGYAVAYRTHDFAIFYGSGRIYEHSAEHLHVDASPEHLYQPVIRLSGIRLEEHQRHLSFRREQRSVSLMMRFVKMRANFLCYFFQWQLCIDAPEFTDYKTLPIFLHKIELGKWQCCRNIRYFS